MSERDSNEIKKQYLKSYENSCKKLKSLEEQLQSIREVAESAKAQTITDMPSGGNQTDLSDYMVRVEILEKKIQEKKEECYSKRLEIENCISDINSGIESTILHKKYIECKPWEKVCVEINYSWRQTHRLHSDALKDLQIL